MYRVWSFVVPVEAYIEPIAVVVSAAPGSESVKNSFSPIVMFGTEVVPEVVIVPLTNRLFTDTVPDVTAVFDEDASPLISITVLGEPPSGSVKSTKSVPVDPFLTLNCVPPMDAIFLVVDVILLNKYIFLSKILLI